MTRRVLALLALQFAAAAAHACRFAQDAQPAQWYAWSSALFAAEVSAIERNREKALERIAVRVLETFKGPEAAAATVEVPSRMWASCRLQRPAVGARVLVALNANGDTLLVPLEAAYAELLRIHKEAK